MSDPFAVLPNEVSYPIDKSQHDFKFTRNWFRNRNQATWSTFLYPRFKALTHQPFLQIKMLQIGVFEGMDLVWCMQNICSHPKSRVVAVDPWLPTTKLDAEYMAGVEARARHNLSPWKDKIKIIKGFSQNLNIVGDDSCLSNDFDLVIIDGDHDAQPVVSDAILALSLLKPGGWMVFDDVRNRVPKKDHVQAGIDMFLEQYNEQVKLEWRHRYCDCYSKV